MYIFVEGGEPQTCQVSLQVRVTLTLDHQTLIQGSLQMTKWRYVIWVHLYCMNSGTTASPTSSCCWCIVIIQLNGGGDLSMKHHNMLLAHSSYVAGESEKILGHHPAVKDPTKVDLIPVQRTSTILRKLWYFHVNIPVALLSYFFLNLPADICGNQGQSLGSEW